MLPFTIIRRRLAVVCASALLSLAPPCRSAPTADPWSEPLQHDPRLAREVGWLDSAAGKTMYLYRPSAGAERGAVVLLHNLGEHADWPQVIRPLREMLPDHGWATLSLELPRAQAPLQAEAYLQAASQPISNALDFLRKQHEGPVLLVGAGTGAVVAAWWLSHNPKASVDGLVAVSLRPLPGQSVADGKELIAKVEPPVLEIYAQADLPDVLAGTESRRALVSQARAGAAGGKARPRAMHYRQIEIDGAGPDYSAQEEVLAKRIRGWIRALNDR